MIIVPAQPKVLCITCGRPAIIEIAMNLRRTGFCEACRKTLGQAFRLGLSEPETDDECPDELPSE